MIIDSIENASRYFMLHPSLEQAFDKLEEIIDVPNIESAKNEIVKDHLYVNTIVGDSKDFDNSIWESHDKYIDIHFLIEGEEQLYFAEEGSLEVETPYNEEKDVTIFNGEGGNEIFLPKNGFVIYFPGEIHKTMVNTKKTNLIKKVVVKLGTF